MCSGDVRQGDERRAAHQRDRRDPMAEPANHARDFVGGDPHGEVGHREDRLIEHQDVDDCAGGNADRGGEPRQIDGIDGPAEREDELQHGKV